jgi:nucleotide-binding universal stress UspA family protein
MALAFCRAQEGFTMIALQRILVPHDFSETSEAAVKYGIALARNFGARLFLLHVGDQARMDLETEFPLGLEGAVEDAVRERLLKILTPAEQAELKPEFAVCAGAPAGEIVNYAKGHDIDLIVMGTHGRGFVGHVVMGSVAEKVVRTAPCPVLTVRRPQHEFVVPDAVTTTARIPA